MTGTGPAAGSPGGAEPLDALACLARGLYAYLREVDGYREVCRRHEGTAVVLAAGEIIHVARYFDGRGAAAVRLVSALGRLPGRTCPAGESGGEPVPVHIVRREVVWEHRRLIVRARRLPGSRLVEVAVAAPRYGDTPDLPLRRLADVLRCHEFLVPGHVEPPVPPPGGGDGGVGVREYLKRAMPPNLVASQCIWEAGEA